MFRLFPSCPLHVVNTFPLGAHHLIVNTFTLGAHHLGFGGGGGMDTRNQFDMYSFVSQSWCAFWQKNDMLLKWSIVKSISEPKSQRKAYHLKDTSLLYDF